MTPLTENALVVLRHRYLAKGPDGQVVETPEQMFGRVAGAVASAEPRYGADPAETVRIADLFYNLMAEGVFLPNSPTLMNAGRELGMLSACFVLPVPDSIEGIFDSVKDAAMIQKAGGGTGFAFDRLRPTGDLISTSGGTTSGPISFWRVFSEVTNAIQQGAFRRGANMGMMSVTHPDILKFIVAKSRLGAFENFNISVKAADDFIAQVRREPDRPMAVTNPRTGRRYLMPRGLDVESYTLSHLVPWPEGSAALPQLGVAAFPGRHLETRGGHPWPPRSTASAPAGKYYTVGDVWRLIAQCAHATGEPGLCFIDRVNADNPTPQLGLIEATNPCGEQPLLDYEACNLGSINLACFVKDKCFDQPGFARVVRLAVRFLDDVIDVNNYVVEPIRKICMGNRKIGLGVMGFAEALMKLGISYDSDEAVAFGQRVAKVLTEEVFAASEDLAAKRGAFPNYAGSVWETRRGRKVRNAAVTTVAPTGTISIIAGCSGGIEPVFALAFWRNVLGGTRLLEVNAVFRRIMEERGLWSEELGRRLASGEPLKNIPDVPEELHRLFVTAHDVPPQRHVQMQAVFQKYVDGAISKTINLPRSAAPADVERIYLLAYDSGCKGITVYRDGCRPAQPMSFEAAPAPESSPLDCPRCHGPLNAQVACSRCPRCGYTICS